MTTTGHYGQTLDPQICVDMGKHSWENCGLDVPDDPPLRGKLVSVKRCRWCGVEKRATYKGRKR